MRLPELRQTLLANGFDASPAGKLVVRVAIGDRHQSVRIVESGGWFRLRCRIAPTGARSVAELLAYVLAENEHQAFATFGRTDEGYDTDHLIARVDLPVDTRFPEIRRQLVAIAALADERESRHSDEDRY
jgi:hypothetical protein